MSDTLGSRIVARADKVFRSEERSNFVPLWDDITKYIVTIQNVMHSGKSPKGEKKTRDVFDSTAGMASRDLSAAIHSTLTNPATQWSKLSFTRDDLNNNPTTVAWLEEVNKTIHREFNESNFDTEISRLYRLFPAVATGILFQEEKSVTERDGFNGFQFRAIHLSEIAFTQNHEGKVDTIYRKFPMTASQLVGKFGKENVSEKVLRSLEDPTKNDEDFNIVHCVSPRDPKDIKLDTIGLAAPDERPISSIYVEEESDHILEEGGYYEMPVHVVRWETIPGETYGRGPGELALPDVKTLNKVKEHGLHQQALALRPPIIANHRTIMGNLDLRPGSVSIVKDTDQVKEFVTAARFDVASFSAEDLKKTIKEIFFLDKLFLPPRDEIGEMTAFEASQRVEQMQRVIGPTIARITNELLQPLIIRSFRMLLRSGALPPVPVELEGGDLDVKITFQNQLARAQQFEDVNNIQAWIQQVGAMAELNPEVIDYVDFDAAAKHTAQIIGIPEKVLANDKDVNQIRKQRAEQQQMAMAMEAGVAAADIASKTQGSGGGQQ